MAAESRECCLSRAMGSSCRVGTEGALSYGPLLISLGGRFDPFLPGSKTLSEAGLPRSVRPV